MNDMDTNVWLCFSLKYNYSQYYESILHKKTKLGGYFLASETVNAASAVWETNCLVNVTYKLFLIYLSCF